MTRAEELAEPHWGYIRGLMESTGVDQKIIDACAYVYITAFIHGYKHALEDIRDEQRISSAFSLEGGLGEKWVVPVEDGEP